MRDQKQRALFARATTISMTAIGMAIGYLLGSVLALQVGENWLDQY
jgi:hypothetical protein